MTRLIGILLALALLIGAIYWLRFTDEQTVNATAYGVEKIIKTHSDSDGRIRTNIYYLLNTDHGTYHIGIDGLYAHPEYAQLIQADSLYQITSIGKSLPFWGIYPQVKELKKLKR